MSTLPGAIKKPSFLSMIQNTSEKLELKFNKCAIINNNNNNSTISNVQLQRGNMKTMYTSDRSFLSFFTSEFGAILPREYRVCTSRKSENL